MTRWQRHRGQLTPAKCRSRIRSRKLSRPLLRRQRRVYIIVRLRLLSWELRSAFSQPLSWRKVALLQSRRLRRILLLACRLGRVTFHSMQQIQLRSSCLLAGRLLKQIKFHQRSCVKTGLFQ